MNEKSKRILIAVLVIVLAPVFLLLVFHGLLSVSTYLYEKDKEKYAEDLRECGLPTVDKVMSSDVEVRKEALQKKAEAYQCACDQGYHQACPQVTNAENDLLYTECGYATRTALVWGGTPEEKFEVYTCVCEKGSEYACDKLDQCNAELRTCE